MLHNLKKFVLVFFLASTAIASREELFLKNWPSFCECISDLIEQGKYTESANDCDKILEFGTIDLRLTGMGSDIIRALALIDINQPEKALTICDKMLESEQNLKSVCSENSDPDCHCEFARLKYAYYYKSLALFYLDRYEEALIFCDKALESLDQMENGTNKEFMKNAIYILKAQILPEMDKDSND